MRKYFFLACMMLGMTTAQAQESSDGQDVVSAAASEIESFSFENFIPTTLGFGVGLGTSGVTVDLSTHLSDYIGLRAGVNWVPEVKIGTDLDLSEVSGFRDTDAGYTRFITENGNIPKNLKVEGKLSMTTWHVLFDVYPFTQTSSFHVTLGAYFGAKKIIKVYNKEDGALKIVSRFNESLTGVNPDTHEGTFTYRDNSGITYPSVSGVKQIGVELGDYFLEPTTEGNLDASIQVEGFRPYVGLGFGRAVPKNRIGLQFDLGCQFWGTPGVYVNGKNGEEKLTKDNTKGEGGDALKILSKISVYPTMTLRLVGRIF